MPPFFHGVIKTRCIALLCANHQIGMANSAGWRAPKE